MQAAIGIDFGTTNSSVARALSSGPDTPPQVDLVTFPGPASSPITPSFRSILYLEQHRQRTRSITESFTGPAAIDHYLNRHLSAPSPAPAASSSPSNPTSPPAPSPAPRSSAAVTPLEDLIARILTDLRLRAENHFFATDPLRPPSSAAPSASSPPRPPRTTPSPSPASLRTPPTPASKTSTFELEPVAAAYAYESTLDPRRTHPHRRLRRRHQRLLPPPRRPLRPLATLVRTHPRQLRPRPRRRRLRRPHRPQARLPRPRLRLRSPTRSAKPSPPSPPGSTPTSSAGTTSPSSAPATSTEILRASLRASAPEEPEKIEALITLIDEDLGYQLHQAVQRIKIDLSAHEAAEFRFLEHGSVELCTPVTRADFESWIAPELLAIEQTVDTLLADTQHPARRKSTASSSPAAPASSPPSADLRHPLHPRTRHRRRGVHLRRPGPRPPRPPPRPKLVAPAHTQNDLRRSESAEVVALALDLYGAIEQLVLSSTCVNTSESAVNAR